MFRGIKGMWKTPFLQGNAKWNNIAPNNRDMEFNQYTQILASWICAVHGIDPAELGVKFNQSQNVMFENQEAKLNYSADRGLKDLLFFHQSWMNKLMAMVPEWEEYYIGFTGIAARDQMAELEVDEKQTKTYMTINEKRKEKDLPEIEGGDIISDQTFLQNKQGAAMGGMPGMEGEEPIDEEQTTEGAPEVEEEFTEEPVEKSKREYIEIIV